MASVTLPGMLNALADEVRLSAVRRLAEAGGVVCGQFDVAVSMPALSHHLKVLRETGLLRVTPEGGFRGHELRLAEMEIRFPGVLTSILQVAEVRPLRRPARIPVPTDEPGVDARIGGRSFNRFEASPKTRYACLRSERP